MTYTGRDGKVHLGQILYFAIHKNQSAALINEVRKLQPCEHFSPTKSVFPVTVTHDFEVIYAKAILSKVIFISVQSSFYVAEFPSNLNFD